MADSIPNRFDTWCSLCRQELKVGEALVTKRPVPKADGTGTEEKWVADCKEVEACHERIRAANRKRSAAAKARQASGGSGRLEIDHKTGRRRWRT
jgi:hypothetical protein